MKTMKEMIEVMQAFADGKKIESTSQSVLDWIENPMPQWNWERCDYRIKSEPKYRPFKNINELVLFWKAHYCNSNRPKGTMPLIWVKKCEDSALLIVEYNYTRNAVLMIDCDYMCMDDLFKYYTFLDGKPCGVEE